MNNDDRFKSDYIPHRDISELKYAQIEHGDITDEKG